MRPNSKMKGSYHDQKASCRCQVMEWIYWWGSSSLPDVTAIFDGVDGPFPVDGVLPGLPRLHTLPEGKSTLHASPAKRTSSLIRPTSLKSLVASASAFESVEGSNDEDNLTSSTKMDTAYLHTNGNVEITNYGNGEQLPIPTSMIRSHSVYGDLHGVHADPIVADILRKEPEQETFARLKIVPTEVSSPDKVEVYVFLQECLEMRNIYVLEERSNIRPQHPKAKSRAILLFSRGKVRSLF